MGRRRGGLWYSLSKELIEPGATFDMDVLIARMTVHQSSLKHC
jgi:hypothetical protein